MHTPTEIQWDRLQYDHTIAPDSTINPLVSGFGQDDGSLDHTIAPASVYPSAALHTLSLETLPVLMLGDAGSEAVEGADLQIKGVLGEGGMGLVRLARQATLQREVAVKQVKPAHTTPHTIQALLDEAMFTGSLEHPNIIPVHALGRTPDNTPLLVMKKVEGDCWRDLIRDPAHRFWTQHPGERLDEHLRILMQVCNAVHFAHSRGVIHRDIKPENVMVGAFGEVYLMDWGIALRLGSKDDGKLRGTPAYMAPEMLRAQHSPRTDIYLLGASLHEALTGQPRHVAANTMGTLMAAAVSAPVQYDDTVPAELGEICNRACHLDPSRRYDSALALRAAVADFLKHRSAAKLAAAARQRLQELRAVFASGSVSAAQTLQIYKCFNEGFFALQQSLRDWPAQQQATADLQALLEVMIDYELSQRNAAHAASLISSLPTANEALAARLAALEAALADESSTRARLERLEHDHDLTVSRTQRRAIFRFMSAFFMITAPVLVVFLMFDSPFISIQNATIGVGVFTAIGAVVTLRWRKFLFANAANRAFTTIVGSTFLGILGNRAVGWYMGDSLGSVAIRDVGLVCILSLVGSVVVQRDALIICVIAAFGLVAALIFPHRAPVILLQSGLLILVIFTWRNQKNKSAQ